MTFNLTNIDDEDDPVVIDDTNEVADNASYDEDETSNEDAERYYN